LPPPQYRERFGQEPPGIQWVGFPEALHKAALYEGRPFPEQDLAYAVSQYDASIAYADDQVARLIRHLKQIECFDNTLIIITSDHGEEFWEHGSMLHGTDLYNPQTRVPLLIKLPAAAQRDAISPSPHLQFVDFLPTIAELFALEPPAGMQGTPWGRGRNYALAENYVAWGFHPKWLRELVAIESGEFKYIHSTTGEEEVYDIANDPDETKNLLGSMPEFAKRMRAIKELRDQGVREDRQRQTQEDTDEQRERLRSLGYL
jgi:arylsulfatase A-like enzyme